jgi:hypothetical protein
MWLYIFKSTEGKMMLIAGCIIFGGVIAYVIKATYKREFPFERKD